MHYNVTSFRTTVLACTPQLLNLLTGPLIGEWTRIQTRCGPLCERMERVVYLLFVIHHAGLALVLEVVAV